MTREMALSTLDYVAQHLSEVSDEHKDAGRDIDAGHSAHESQCVAFAAAELRKTCATCVHRSNEPEWMSEMGPCCVLLERFAPVYGFCHRWSPLPPANTEGAE